MRLGLFAPDPDPPLWEGLVPQFSRLPALLRSIAGLREATAGPSLVPFPEGARAWASPQGPGVSASVGCRGALLSYVVELGVWCVLWFFGFRGDCVENRNLRELAMEMQRWVSFAYSVYPMIPSPGLESQSALSPTVAPARRHRESPMPPVAFNVGRVTLSKLPYPSQQGVPKS